MRFGKMATTAIGTIEKLETLAAWHRANAEHAGSEWVWEARLRTAEDLERRAADLRARRHADKGRGAGGEPADQAVRQNAGVRSAARQAAAPRSERSQ
jgi:hypothetical protein